MKGKRRAALSVGVQAFRRWLTMLITGARAGHTKWRSNARDGMVNGGVCGWGRRTCGQSWNRGLSRQVEEGMSSSNCDDRRRTRFRNRKMTTTNQRGNESVAAHAEANANGAWIRNFFNTPTDHH